MVDAQDTHIGAAAGPALGDFAEGLIIDAQEAHRPGCAAGRGVDDILLRTQAAEAEAVAAAGLLNERRDAEGAEDAVAGAAHIVFDGQYEAGGQLAQGRARAREGGAVGEEAQIGEEVVEDPGACFDVATVLLFHPGNVSGDAVEHAGGRLQKLSIDIPAQIAAFQDFQAVFAQLDCAVVHIRRPGNSLLLALYDFEGREGLLCSGAITGDGGFEGGHGDTP